MNDLSKLTVRPEQTLREVMQCIDGNRTGIALIVDGETRLLYTITDGDLRRAVLNNLSLDMTVDAWSRQAPERGNRRPVRASADLSKEEQLAVMRHEDIRHLPLLDERGTVKGLGLLAELVDEPHRPLNAVIMAGGFGTRLLPLTEQIPKPMLPVGGRPLMERLVEQLQRAGIRHIDVATHYKPEKIVEHFGDGRSFGIELNYLNEDAPLGTAGALGVMELPTQRSLVINGDIVTDVDFLAMVAFHEEYKADLTIAVQRYDMVVPYGVLDCQGAFVKSVREKPRQTFSVNGGIYVLEPSVYRLMPRGQGFNMTDVIQWTLDAGLRVVSFPIREYWLDIGLRENYAQAQQDATDASCRS